jgi:diguanylate cyclase (GGDEF)-like protein
MNEFFDKSDLDMQLDMQQKFFEIVTRCQQNLINLDLSEIRAACLTILSQAVDGMPAMLLLAQEDKREFIFEFSSGSLDCPIDRIRLQLTDDELQQILHKNITIEKTDSFQKMLQEAFGRQDVFNRVLVINGEMSGLLIVLPSAGKGFSQKDLYHLDTLGSQIENLFQAASMIGTLMEHAVIDDVSGLFNNRYFRIRLRAEIARASRHHHKLSLLFCEIDDFNTFIDKHGKMSGAKLVKEVAKCFTSRPGSPGVVFTFRTSDVPIHYANGEFVVILPETPKEGAKIKAERLRRHVELTEFQKEKTQPLGGITLSIGVATFPDDGSDSASILEAADRSLYHAKELGKNRVV